MPTNSEVYIPKVCYTYQYPSVQNQHMMKLVEKFHPVLDENYVYRDKSFSWKWKHFWLDAFLNTIVLPVVKIRFAVKVEGKENLRQNRKILKNGFVSVCNHVFEWDFLALLWALYPKKAYFPIWSRNMESPMAPIYRTIGGIPVSTTLHGGQKFTQACDSVLEEHKWLHVFAEGSMWYFYPALREFQKGAAIFAIKHDVPILPLAISYRKPRGIYKLFKKYPNFTVHIGQPLFVDKSLSKKDAERDLTLRAHDSVMQMMGIHDAEENLRIMKELGWKG